MFAQIAVAVLICALGFFYRSIKPPPPKICGSPGGPPVTAQRFRLRDGRHMAYKFVGVPKENAKHKVVLCYGFGGSREMILPYSQEFMEELGVCFIVYDRPGNGESDPNPIRGPETEALDVEELADHLLLGSRFYVLGLSLGAYVAWSCLIYIPHRLSGVSLVGPLINYYWTGLPSKIANKYSKMQPLNKRWSKRIAYYTPWLYYWIMTQKLLPIFTAGADMAMYTDEDLEVIKDLNNDPIGVARQAKATQQGVFYSSFQDLLVVFGKGKYNPLDIKNPFPNNEATVHWWQGGADRIVPAELARFIAEKLPWIKYHELPGKGHMIFHYPDLCESFLREILGR